jgi:hypothetical protein
MIGWFQQATPTRIEDEMSDVITPETETVEPGTIDEQAAEVAAMEPAEAPAEKPAKAKKEPVPCACRQFTVGEKPDGASDEEQPAWTTECDGTTQRLFRQGHDAKLVSFLVSAELDGYSIWAETGGVRRTFPGAAEACGSISEALKEKAARALENQRQRDAVKLAKANEREAARLAKADEKAKAKAEKDAEKAAAKAAKDAAKPAKAKATDVPPVAPREVPVAVVPGSDDGEVIGDTQPTELEEGEEVVTIKVGRNEIQATLSADKKTVSWRNAQDEYKERPADTVRILPTV